MARKEIFAGNWKMYKTYSEAIELIDGMKHNIEEKPNREVLIYPPSVYTKSIVEYCENTPISVGVQNMYFEKEGAFTGEIAPAMVKDTGCKYILIGHSERRHVFSESNEDTNKKVHAAYEYGLIPMLCVGEQLEDREKGLTDKVVEKQVEQGLQGISEDQAKILTIAYEPVWAIGTGKVATPEIAEEVHGMIRTLLGKLFSSEIADIIPILYGGSVKPDNVVGLYAMENIDGALVGGASLKPDSFLAICNV